MALLKEPVSSVVTLASAGVNGPCRVTGTACNSHLSWRVARPAEAASPVFLESGACLWGRHVSLASRRFFFLTA